MKFFENVKTLDELHKEYRRLAFIYHPDKGGVTAIMQIIRLNYFKHLSFPLSRIWIAALRANSIVHQTIFIATRVSSE